MVKHERGLTDEETAEFSRWLAADARHQVCYDEQKLNWTLLDQLQDLRPAAAARPDLDVLAPPPRRLWPRLAVLALAASVVLGWFAIGPNRPGRLPRTTEVMERTLDDGSVVHLNRGTALRLDFRADERRVVLAEGEAHFAVKRDPARPFVVRASGVHVAALGTAFDVKIAPDEVHVLVTEGRVRVDPAESLSRSVEPPGQIVREGELAVIDLRERRRTVRVRPVEVREIERLLGWQPRTLDFVAAPLAEVAAAFNARNDTQLIIADPQLESLRLTLSFRANNVDGFVRVLEEVFAVEATRTGDTIVLRRQR